MKLAFVVPIVSSLHSRSHCLRSTSNRIAEGVEYDTIAREWIATYSLDGDKASLVACQLALESVVEDIHEVEGVKSVQRLVCEDDNEFRVITNIDATKFQEWKNDDFFPEDVFFEMLGVIDGVKDVKSRTSTMLLNVEPSDFEDSDND
jgi:hypothetical protein